MEFDILFLILLPVVAFLYAAVGHGGASGYLALMGLFSFSEELMRPTGLLLNLFVAAVSFYHFWRSGYFNYRLFLYFAIASIPMAFLGGMLEVDSKVYKVVLGFLLLFAIVHMLGFFGEKNKEIRSVNWISGLLVGGGIGFFSGLIGIGGGIILSPLILIFGWGKVKEAAAVSALFIWVNSVSGMIGQWSSGVAIEKQSWLFVGLAFIGGFAGGYFGSKKIDNKGLRYLLAFVLLLASLKLFFI